MWKRLNKALQFLGLVSISLLLMGQMSLKYSFEEYEKQRTLAAIDRGLYWLVLQQGVNGLYHENPALTALVVLAYLKHPEAKYSIEKYSFLRKSVDALLKLQQEDGGIYDANSEPKLPSYNSSVALMALSELNVEEYSEAISKLQNFLRSQQIADSENNRYYGGIGYGSRESVNDLFHTQFAVQALKESGFDDQEVWARAIKFVERCQHYSNTNDQRWSGNNGGFIYAPSGESKAGLERGGKPKAYASMTYAGLLTFLNMDLNRDDNRIKAAIDWIRKHYTIEENYDIGRRGLYYNYFVMVNSLAKYGDQRLIDATGEEHNWYKEISDKLISEQIIEPAEPEQVTIGYWKNENGHWGERDTVLTTAYAILSLEAGYNYR